MEYGVVAPGIAGPGFLRGRERGRGFGGAVVGESAEGGCGAEGRGGGSGEKWLR